jgi:hypothetical protein
VFRTSSWLVAVVLTVLALMYEPAIVGFGTATLLACLWCAALDRRSGSEPISNPGLTLDVPRVRRVGLELLPQLPDQHPKMLGLIDGLRAPDRFEDRAMRQDAPGVPRQQRHEIELFRREADLVDDEIAHLEPARSWLAGAEGATQHGPDPRQ